MNYITSTYQQTKKSLAHMWNPNQNPTQKEKKALQLLDKAQAQLFIEYVQANPDININVVDYSKVSMLIMALSIANRPNNLYKKMFTDQELLEKGIKAMKFVLSKGVDIDYRDKNGSTALLTACHWGNYQIAKILLEHGANPHISSYSKHFSTNPLLSAYVKKKMDLVILLFQHGARVEDVEETIKLSQGKHGFKLCQEDINFLRSLGNIATLVRKRKEDQVAKKKNVLTLMSDMVFQDVCYNI